jgi:hypothetical protein
MDSEHKRNRPVRCEGALGAVYGLGWLGAVIYYIQAANSFWAGAFGIVKAFFWPAFLVYEAFRTFGA